VEAGTRRRAAWHSPVLVPYSVHSGQATLPASTGSRSEGEEPDT